MRIILVLTLLLVAPGLAQSQSDQPVDIDRLGPQVGGSVPDFSAVDQNWRTHTLESVLGPKGAMLVFNVDPEGRVVERFFEAEYQFRNTAASVALKMDRPIPSMGTPSRQTSRHLSLTTFTSDEVVAPGHRFSIVLDVVPRPGIHVYAPGKHTYRVIALRLEPNSLVRTYPMVYSESVEYHFVPLDERVQVYDKLFKLVQDAAVVVTRETRQLAQESGAAVTLSGALEYQACTDTICYPPAEIQLEWTVGLKPLQ